MNKYSYNYTNSTYEYQKYHKTINQYGRKHPYPFPFYRVCDFQYYENRCQYKC